MWAELVAWFHGLSGKEKAGLAAAVVATAGVGWYIHQKNAAAQTAAASGSATTGTVYDVNGNPMNGPTPIIPVGPPGPPTPAPVGSNRRSVTAGPSDSLSGLAQANGLSLQQLYGLNPWAGNPSGPFGAGQSYNPYQAGNITGLQVYLS